LDRIFGPSISDILEIGEIILAKRMSSTNKTSIERMKKKKKK
jgi:hypothetical protein